MSRFEFVVPKISVGENPRLVMWTEGELIRIQVYPEYEDINLTIPGGDGASSMAGRADKAAVNDNGDWSSDGVTLPQYTELRFSYDGEVYEGIVLDGTLAFGDNIRQKATSGAMMAAIRERTGKVVNVNGWNYITALLPGAKSEILLGQLRSTIKRRAT